MLVLFLVFIALLSFSIPFVLLSFSPLSKPRRFFPRNIQQAGQVWFPDSAYKTAQALRDFNREELPLFIFANWRGFSGGMKDMYEMVSARKKRPFYSCWVEIKVVKKGFTPRQIVSPLRYWNLEHTSWTDCGSTSSQSWSTFHLTPSCEEALGSWSTPLSILNTWKCKRRKGDSFSWDSLTMQYS